ncbi:LytTR family DNA-binding domain-containing protein [Pedobacter sp. KR3-3]|uniref:LytTR family DNA-binding domain-containing protein n=1 Tax=Pedobacter albus TaxID=3113905 RepID=A0ABU7IDF7_9SPHI|nr:LytTR family DNA-binding domain-containing protein [Pedobacter sp. KR3-3]MEE1947229.1 LytTR family DNA-binding domain-containing protein [Pedobacter sp. KR3-3]
MIRCLIIDDKPLAIDILTDYVSQIPFLTLVHSTTHPLEALQLIMDEKVDLVFLDIQMPQLTGIQLMKIAQGKCKVILTTAYAEYALDGFENDAIDYLLKPIAFDRFYKAVQKAREILERKAPSSTEHPPLPNAKPADYIFVRSEYKLVKIDLNTILYAEGLQNYVAIYTETEKIVSLQNIKKLEEQLPSAQFARVHKSYIVGIGKIKSIERNRIFIGEEIIPLGDAYRESFYRQIEPNSQ